MALCGTTTTLASAQPKRPAQAQATRGPAQGPTRLARTEPPTTARAGRAGKIAPVEKKGTQSDSKKAPAIAEPKVNAESVGPPNDGRLEGGIRLDVSKPYLRVVPAYNYKDADTRWGLPALVRALDRAAKAVSKKYPGAVLGVGDISRKNGGELANHHSHESGRDADLGFYVIGEKNQPVLRHGFVKIDENLTAPEVPGARFDVARNWLFIQTLLLDREARVSHIFVSEPIKHALLAHARSRGVARALYVRAAQVMMQPTGGLPHDDHFHVRISCPSKAKTSCVEIAKNAPSKARLKMAKKGRSGMKTPARKQAARPQPKRTAEAKQARTEPTGGIYLSRTTKNEGGPDVPVSLWALAGAPIGGAEERKTAQGDPDEAESDAVDVKDAIDEDGAPRITQ
jgi:penicillin-insensitive murein endopeptidase